MSLLVVGSIALDTLDTPAGRREDCLGGSAVHFSLAARHFTRPRLVGVVGEDFPPQHVELLRRSGIDVAGVSVQPGGETFRWSGRYRGDLQEAETLDLKLNVFADYQPVVPEAWKDSDFVFLANGSPVTQLAVRRQVPDARFVMADSMNHWIASSRDDLLRLIAEVHALILNHTEAVMLAGTPNLVAAAQAILGMGPQILIVKRGEHGASLFARGRTFALPAYPIERVVDPTGAGDSFAGGVMGSLAQADLVDWNQLKRALLYGTVVASFCVEDFGTARHEALGRADVEARAQQLREMITI
jgi:sugar/nucleoside kinase (ribokinase family)